MKKVVFQFSVSLDGYFEGPHREIDWHVLDDAFNAYIVEMLDAADVLIMGRVNYELMASYWPTAPNDAVKKFMNGKPKLVFSRTLKEVTWQNSRLATGSISEEVARLKQQQPGDGLLWVGGSGLASQFLDLGLLDEVRLILTPVFLGGGHTLFDGIKARHKLKYVSARTFDSGSVLMTYRPVRN